MTSILTGHKYTNSITGKLTLMIAAASGIALLLCCAAFVYNDVAMLRRAKARELTSVAEVMASNSTAVLAFGVKEPAVELLESLNGRRDIISARLFDSERTLFASYATDGSDDVEGSLPPLDHVGHRFSKHGVLEVVLPIADDGEHLGFIQLRATTGDLHGQIQAYIGIAAGVILTSLIVAIVLGARLQRFISDPLSRLAHVAHRVSESGDYSVRVDKPSNDEIGELYEEFNAMLGRIEHANAAVHRAHEELRDINAGLEERVRERTDELVQANAELEFSENRVRAIIESAGDGILTTDERGILQSVNPAAKSMFGHGDQDLIGREITLLLNLPVGEFHDRQHLGSRRDVTGTHEDGSKFPVELAVYDAVVSGQHVFTSFVRDLTVIKEAEQQLASMNEQLVETSRRAGMAEVANNVLHNVGNVLNSVNVAAELIGDSVRNSEITDLNRVLALVNEHRDDFPGFLETDPRGKHLPSYLIEAGSVLASERDAVMAKLTTLTKNIDHIKDIVSTQQSYAGMSGVEQIVELDSLMEDAVQINSGSLERHQIDVVREYDKLPPASVDKQKVMQILINLINNARHAIRDAERVEGEIRLRVQRETDWVNMSVSDNGIGISEEVRERLFRHGFTTKTDGHGFGLHSAALAAKEMGGALTVHSAGLRAGATFTLKLPLRMQKVSA